MCQQPSHSCISAAQVNLSPAGLTGRFCSPAGDVVRAPSGVMHGKTSPVFHTNEGLLEGLDK
jgi:hypothetical protein